MVDTFLKNPVKIEVAKPATTAKTIEQTFCFCGDGEDWEKRELLRDLIRAQNVKNAIIFCNRKRDVSILFKSLTKHGFNAGALHGDMDQTSRMDTLEKFRSGEITFLAASDVAARGLDIPDVSHVFNFDVPWASDDYVHRIGRTGRAGREGFAATLVTIDELKVIKEIEGINGEALSWQGEARQNKTSKMLARRSVDDGDRRANPIAAARREAAGVVHRDQGNAATLTKTLSNPEYARLQTNSQRRLAKPISGHRDDLLRGTHQLVVSRPIQSQHSCKGLCADQSHRRSALKSSTSSRAGYKRAVTLKPTARLGEKLNLFRCRGTPKYGVAMRKSAKLLNYIKMRLRVTKIVVVP